MKAPWQNPFIGIFASLFLLLFACPQSAQCQISRGFDHAIFRAIRVGDVDLVRNLVTHETPVKLKTPNGTTPLMLAARAGSPELVTLLLKQGAEVNATNDLGVTALHWGVGYPRVAQILLDAGADLNAVTKRGNTPLLIACAFPGSIDTVKLLTKHGARLDVQARSGGHPLFQAAGIGNLPVIRFLISHGVNPDHGPPRRSALINALRFSHDRVAKLLLKEGADPNRGDGFGGHSLNVALFNQRTEVVPVLISAGAKIDGPPAKGKVPPIMLASYTETGDPYLARLLLEHGADVTSKNDAGETALTWAKLRGFPELIRLFEENNTPEGNWKEKAIPQNDIQLTEKNRQESLTRSVRKSLNLLQKSSDAFLQNRGSCVSCHHQNVPSMALGMARDRGFEVDESSIQAMVDRQVKNWSGDVERIYQMEDPVPVPTRFLGWGLLGFAALGYPSDELTDAPVWYLAATQEADGHWSSEIPRPPLGDNGLASTVLAMRSLQLYPIANRRAEMLKRVRRARRWLEDQRSQTHQDRVFRLLGMGWAGSSERHRRGEVRALVNSQKRDGGWSQLPHLRSDAWATGTALLALHLAGSVATTDPVYVRGLEFLLRTEFADGSWYVKTRTWPFQPHFDSRFPHGKDQWISAPATAWATMAMILAADPVNPGVAPVDDVFLGGTRREPHPATTKAVAKTVAPGAYDFVGKIKPILERSCLHCHDGDKPKAGLRMTSREKLLKGGESGEATIRPGNGEDSLMVRVVSGQVEDLEMPPLSKREKYPALTKEEIGHLRAWIDAGAPWD